MSTITLNTKSLHYRLATVYGGMSVHFPARTICTYAVHTFFGIFRVLLCILAGAFVSVLLSDFLAWIAAMVMTLSWIVPDADALIIAISIFVIGGVVVTITGVVLIGNWSCAYLDNKRKRELVNEPEPGLITQAYRSWKDKVCVYIKFK